MKSRDVARVKNLVIIFASYNFSATEKTKKRFILNLVQGHKILAKG